MVDNRAGVPGVNRHRRTGPEPSETNPDHNWRRGRGCRRLRQALYNRLCRQLPKVLWPAQPGFANVAAVFETGLLLAETTRR